MFDIDHSVVLARLQRAEDRGTDPMAELDELIAHAHAGSRATARLETQARQRLEELVAAGIVEPVHGEDGMRYTVYEDLQEDFSVYHDLSLFLVHLLSRLDPDDPDHALDVISCVEAILEHPKVVLYAQVRKAKSARIAELKAAGVPYEERLEALEEITWPKPRAEWIYATFEQWKESRPWAAGHPIRPKGIVREIVEGRQTFASYINDLSIDRSEGVLLRYITQAYRTLHTGVPTEHHSDALVDALGFLRAFIARADDSLLTAWESLTSPDAEPDTPPPPPDISRDLKSFRARVRAELHGLVQALAQRDYEEAEAAARQSGRHPFRALDFRTALHSFEEEAGGVAWDARVRQPWHSHIEQLEPHRWRVGHRLLPADLDIDPDDLVWSLVGEIDLREDTNPSGPIIEVLSVGEG